MRGPEMELLEGGWNDCKQQELLRQLDAAAARRRRVAGAVAVALLAVGLLACLAAAIGLGVRLRKAESRALSVSVSPECLHALGGGFVRPGGSLDSASPEFCRQQLKAYADPVSGGYWREVELAAHNAITVLGLGGGGGNNTLPCGGGGGEEAPAAQRRLLLQLQRGAAAAPLGGPGRPLAAAAAASSAPPPPPAPDARKVVVFDIDETVLSNLEQILDPERWPWDQWVAAARAPAIAPVQRLYRALCRAGFSVAFVTGRKEDEDGRAKTASNLEAAGYGRQCGAGGAAAAGGGECCYRALWMRPPNDTRLASVYKPWARSRLLAGEEGLELLALVGDQWSDLDGENAAPYAFKLPNPFYFIL